MRESKEKEKNDFVKKKSNFSSTHKPSLLLSLSSLAPYNAIVVNFIIKMLRRFYVCMIVEQLVTCLNHQI